MRRTLLGSCEGCINISPDSSKHCNNKYPDHMSCKGCRLHTKPSRMGTTAIGGIKHDCTICCRCLQDATSEELEAHVCKYRRSK
uniref:Uncharacterized protein n=1 Tax=Podoviridae sp. ctaNW81 TaxID=2826562 RepID=A0A8S5M665_9CAUD|nr:MAG TPA: hypothetical protein [Podoviridae sp. ctaNW81]